MDEDAWKTALDQELDVDFVFPSGKGPTFGDLVLLAGSEPGREFPPSGHFASGSLANLGFESCDDYLGTPNFTEEGDDVVLWLYPLIDGEIVDHHPGPYSGLRLGYSVLRNPKKRVKDFLAAISECALVFKTAPLYRLRETDLSVAKNLTRLKKDIEAIAKHWQSKGVEPGSAEALLIE